MTIRARKAVYSDIDLLLAPHPNTGDVTKKLDANAVKQSVKNILMTNKGEKFFDPNFGGGLRSMLFENFSTVTASLLRTQIRYALENYEPRITVDSIDVTDDIEGNALRVSVGYTIKSPEGETDVVDILVERLR